MSRWIRNNSGKVSGSRRPKPHSVANFSVGQIPQVFPEFLGAGAENRFCALQRDTADEEYRTWLVRHGVSPVLPARFLPPGDFAA